jgi:pimeloyl-ACP methyl ester carboxylesterase
VIIHNRCGSGTALILIHGIGSRRGAWDPVVPALATQHDVIAIDLPGFGDSQPLNGPVNPITLCDAVVSFAGELGLEPGTWHVAGNSMGGAISLELAARGIVKTATAISPAGFWSLREIVFTQKTLNGSRSLGRRLRGLGLAAPILRTATGRTLFMGQIFSRPWRLSAEEAIADLDDFVDCPSWDEALAAFSDYRAPFAHAAVPVTIAWGTRDWLLLPRQARRARRAMPKARHVWLPGCGHTPFSDDPPLLAATLLESTAQRSLAG